MPFVYSTLTCDNKYPLYKDVKIGDRTVKRAIPGSFVTIKGGANVAVSPHKMFVDPHGMPIHTPQVGVTHVTEAQLEILKQNFSFNRQVAAKFIMIVEEELKPEQARQELTPKDGSAPKTPADYNNKVKRSKNGKQVEIELPDIPESN